MLDNAFLLISPTVRPQCVVRLQPQKRPSVALHTWLHFEFSVLIHEYRTQRRDTMSDIILESLYKLLLIFWGKKIKNIYIYKYICKYIYNAFCFVHSCRNLPLFLCQRFFLFAAVKCVCKCQTQQTSCCKRSSWLHCGNQSFRGFSVPYSYFYPASFCHFEKRLGGIKCSPQSQSCTNCIQILSV